MKIGTPLQAIKYATSLEDTFEGIDFLRCWEEGDVSEWPMYLLQLEKDQ